MSFGSSILVPGSWKWPERRTCVGRYCVLEPFELRHKEELRGLYLVPDAATRYQYVFNVPDTEPGAFEKWLTELIGNKNLIVFAVIDKATGKVEGKQHLMGIDPENGVIELGGVLWGPKIARTRVATEAFYLMTSYVFDELHYRRYEWECHNNNVASKKAALRFGFTFEAIFRQHYINRGRNRDSSWFSMLDLEWSTIKLSFEKWLDQSNFDDNGQQRQPLSYFGNQNVKQAGVGKMSVNSIFLNNIPMEPEKILVPGSWKWPDRKTLVGRYCILEPLEAKHRDELFAVCTVPDAATRYRYLLGLAEPQDFDAWLSKVVTSKDPIPFVVIDKSTGKVEGKQHFMRIVAEHGVVEIGSILWGPNIARTRVATEAFYLMASYVFDELKYRRFEWKCNNDWAKSKDAALRFGFKFEGVFRQHCIDHGQNRDTAWFSILDHEWPTLKTAFEKWLDESNFDEQGKQKLSLSAFKNN